MSQLALLSIFCVLVVIASLIGGLIPWWGRLKADRIPVLVSASAGVLLGTALLHLLPEAYHRIGLLSLVLAVFGFIFLYLLELLFHGYGHGHGHVHGEDEEHTHSHDDVAHPPASALAAFVGLSLHSLLDGLALGVSSSELQLQSVIFIALLLHKAPTGFSLSAILRMGNVSFRKGFLYLLVFTLFVPVGAFLFLGLSDIFDMQLITAYTLAFSAGNFFHVAVDDLLPEVGREAKDPKAAILGFIIGFLIPILLLAMPEV